MADHSSDLGEWSAELFPDVVGNVFNRLTVKDLVNAGLTCCSWHKVLGSCWKQRCLSRWRHWTVQPPSDAEPAVWRQAYAARHAMDRLVLDKLSAACDLRERSECLGAIMDCGADALDVLTAAAQAKQHSGLFVGTGHRAHIALLLLKSQQAAGVLRGVLDREQAAQLAAAQAGAEALNIAEPPAAAAAAAAATGPGCAGSSTAPTHDGEEDFVLEVAMQLAGALHPLCDVSAMRRAVEQLAAELNRRLRAAGAQPGSQQALDLLNTLMFSNAPAAAAAAPAGEQQAATEGTSTAQHSSHGQPTTALASNAGSSSSSSCGTTWSTFWPRNVHLHGPDLSGFQVPTGSDAGLGQQGDWGAFERVSGSCLDSVLSDRTGLPITLCILHRAVGRAGAGLDIQLLNVPGRVINRVLLSSSDAAISSSSSSSKDCVYFDVFARRALSEEEFRVLSRPPAPPAAGSSTDEARQRLDVMSGADTCRRMLANLVNLYRSWTGAQPMHARLAAPCFGLACFLGKSGQFWLYERLWLEATFNGMAEVYARLLTQTGIEVQQELVYTFAEMQHKQHSTEHKQTSGPLQVGAHVRFSSTMVDNQQQTGFVVAADSSHGLPPAAMPANMQGPAFTVLTTFGPFAECLLATSLSVQPMAPEGSAACCWQDCVPAAAEAQQLLRSLWYEPDFAAAVSGLCQRYSQPEPEGLGTGDAALADMRACDLALGQDFEAVWFDNSQRRWCLLPNAFVRSML